MSNGYQLLTRELAMRLWHWILGLFRGRTTEPTAADLDAQRRAHLDARAADAARTADARLPPHNTTLPY